LTAVTVITTVELDVRSTDIDGDGIVNNAVYFVYFEQVRLAHLMRLGVIWRPRRPGERNFTLAATEAQFLAPLTYPETVVASAWTARVGNTSFRLEYELTRKSDGVPVARGSSVQVWLDESGRPIPLPPLVRHALENSLRVGRD
jgi:acyl-CoA thioester hydrolase